MMKPRICLFAEQEREDRRAKIGDPLVGLAEHVDFDALAARIDAAAPTPSRAKGGRPPYPTVLMIKNRVIRGALKSIVSSQISPDLIMRQILITRKGVIIESEINWKIKLLISVSVVPQVD
ncbi:hypothetical protein [Massilia luteola]|uniref:hypothetical protein n=1 Tax=Massilia luteola TaxID=3081751 RepID=UPI002ACC2834|nr:hypothetical protein [Massilia sp. Gc5]